MKPYWKTIILIIIFLTVEAFCDLALPQYTSGIIDTGIQNQGIEHILPAKIKEREFQEAEVFMTEKEMHGKHLMKKMEKSESLLSIKKNDWMSWMNFLLLQ